MKAQTLNNENAPLASLIVNKNNPEWGSWPIFFVKGDNTSIGRGSHSKILMEREFHYWEVVSWK